MKHPDKIELLKKAVCVSGKPLLHGNPSDEKIDTEINILMGAIIRGNDEIKHETSRIYSKLDFSWDEKKAEEFIRETFYKFVGFNDGPLDNNFWINFGSAPFYTKYVKDEYKNKGSVGMDEIFGKQFEHCYSYIYEIRDEISSLTNAFTEKKKRLTQKKEIFSSPYKDLNELEENVVAKKIKDEAFVFFSDKTKSLENRLEVFKKYGKTHSYIHEPSNPDLARIFEIYKEREEMQRHETADCIRIVESWVNSLVKGRRKISYESNRHHPKIKGTVRNYTPSKESIERLKNYYLEILLEEGTSSFKFDW